MFISILLVIFNVYSRKNNRKKTDKVDYGKVYSINVVCTFVAMTILCDDIYEFLLFQVCLLLGALFITRYINNIK